MYRRFIYNTQPLYSPNVSMRLLTIDWVSRDINTGHITHNIPCQAPHRHNRLFAAKSLNMTVMLSSWFLNVNIWDIFVCDRNDPITNNLTCLNILFILLQTHSHWLEAWEYSVLLIWLGDLLQCKKGKTESQQTITNSVQHNFELH